MDILVDRNNESVVFTFPDGSTVDITMVNVFGEDSQPQNDKQEAFRILKEELKYFDKDDNFRCR